MKKGRVDCQWVAPYGLLFISDPDSAEEISVKKSVPRICRNLIVWESGFQVSRNGMGHNPMQKKMTI